MQQVEPFLKSILTSLDLQYQSPTSSFPSVEAYATQFVKQIKPQSAVIVNGKPINPRNTNAKIEFQKKWLATPLTTHQLNSYDCHIIPGTGVMLINASGKVRFDESGRSKLGETPDLVQNPSSNLRPRPEWGSWFGFDLNLAVDEAMVQNVEEVVNTFNYRLTYKPDDSVIQF